LGTYLQLDLLAQLNLACLLADFCNPGRGAGVDRKCCMPPGKLHCSARLSGHFEEPSACVTEYVVSPLSIPTKGPRCRCLAQSSPGRAMLTSAIALFALAATTTAVELSRDPKLFYISSSTTTSTLKTVTVCFKSSTAAMALCARKKKKRDITPVEGLDINPSRNSRMGDKFDDGEVELGSGEKSMRDPKFLLYWATLTSTSTSTSYTSTQTIYSLGCTPAGFGTSLCG
jgi:hypothetical protein